MHSHSSDALAFCIWGLWVTHQYRKKFSIQYAFTVENMHCTHHLDPMYALLTGKRNRLVRLRRQKKRSESYFRTVSHGLQPTDSPPHLIFLVCWLEENTPPISLRFGKLMAQTTSFTALQKHFNSVYFTVRNRRCMHIWKQFITQSVEILLRGKNLHKRGGYKLWLWGLSTVVIVCWTKWNHMATWSFIT